MTVTIRVDVSALDGVADSLQYLDDRTLGEIRRNAVNEMSLIVRRKTVDDAARHLNLSRDYIETRVARDEAARGASAVARVRTPVRGTTLQRYGNGPVQLTKPVTWSNSRIAAEGHKLGAWPDWTERKGDKRRGIPANYKAAGLQVQPLRGKGASVLPGAFTMPLRGGNGMGVFVQRGSNKLKHLYGPNVYHTFRRFLAENQDSIADGLRDQFIAGFDTALQRIGK